MALELSARRLLLVSGKGGVGKSTVAAAIGVGAARRGLRTVVAEVAGRRDVASLLGATAAKSPREVEVYPGLHHVSIERQPALEEYLRNEVPGPLPAGILAHSRAFQLFVDAAPGMAELLTIGKVWELAQRPRHSRGGREYDLVVLDGPASGQLAGLLAAPRTFGPIARVGPVARQSAVIDQMLTDPEVTAVVAVATPEQMAVSETLGMRTVLRGDFGIELAAVIVNRLFPSRFSAREIAALSAAPDDPAVGSARWVHARGRAQQVQVARLRRALGNRSLTTLPFLFAGVIGRDGVEQLGERLLS